MTRTRPHCELSTQPLSHQARCGDAYLDAWKQGVQGDRLALEARSAFSNDINRTHTKIQEDLRRPAEHRGGVPGVPCFCKRYSGILASEPSSTQTEFSAAQSARSYSKGALQLQEEVVTVIQNGFWVIDGSFRRTKRMSARRTCADGESSNAYTPDLTTSRSLVRRTNTRRPQFGQCGGLVPRSHSCEKHFRFFLRIRLKRKRLR